MPKGMRKKEWSATVEISLPGCDSCVFDLYDIRAYDETEADSEAWDYLAKNLGTRLFHALQPYIEIHDVEEV